ncbi:PREDICTED: cellular retinoic acid-binding protein 1-like, partial [Priapulus caudatus]|uniref:Cellular retinoic acid-binding protein 1-like n=1 Tax=Priapulus caudatus TaxID=37621 RepID=A0ABM1F688_PRICU
MRDYSGSYVADTQEGFREYLKNARGLNDAMIAKILSEKIHMDVKQDGDKIHLKTYTPDRVIFDNSFVVWKPFEYTRETTGKLVQMCFKWEGEDLMHESVDSDGTKEIVHRQMLPDGSIKA